MRIIVPMIAGVAQMPFGRFALANASGAAVSALLYGSLGYFFGRDLETLNQHIAVVTAVIIVVIIAILIARAWIAGRRRASRAADALDQSLTVRWR